MSVSISRRACLIRCGSLYAAVVSGLGTTGCAQQGAESTSCIGASSLSDTDRKTRASFAYVEQSTIADRKCGNCSLYVAPSDGGSCGGCQIIKGRIGATAYCNVWAPKAV